MKDTVRTAFTPGPWTASDDGLVRMPPTADFRAPGVTVISPNEKADARLIAAAPDMYQALRELVGEVNVETLIPEGLTSGTAISTYGVFAEKVIRAQATLRKADGRD